MYTLCVQTKSGYSGIGVILTTGTKLTTGICGPGKYLLYVLLLYSIWFIPELVYRYNVNHLVK